MSQTKAQILNPLNGNLNVTGVVTASSFVGNITGNADTASYASTSGVSTVSEGLTGTPDITVNNVVAVAATFSGNVSIAGTLTYEDVTNVDSIGLVTARNGIQVLASGVDVTGIGTFKDRIAIDGSIAEAGGGTVTYNVTVVTKDSTHRYNGQGFGSGYAFDGLQAPFLQLTPGRTYRFDQSDSSNSGHPLLFYNDADKTTQYTLNVTTSGTPGVDGYTEISVTDTTPVILHYQCSVHAYMGNAVNTNSKVAGGAYLSGILKEQVKVTAGKLSDNTNIDLENGMVHLFTTTETTTSTPNIRYNASTSLNSIMDVGEAISVTLVTTAAAAGYSAQLTIDGSAVTENWTGGSAPTDGGASGVDIYTYTIMKTASATYTVIASQTKTS